MTQARSLSGRSNRLARGTPAFHRFVLGGHLRYAIIAVWALALGTVLLPQIAFYWFLATLSAGLLRGIADARLPRSSRKTLTLVAGLSCIAWASGPWLAWSLGGAAGQFLAVFMLSAGYALVFTQMRANPGEALCVSIPYSVVLGAMLLSLWGQDSFWTLLAGVPVLALALAIKVAITEVKDGELKEVVAEQARLIVDLESSREIADRANNAKSMFLGIISHELRTPMNGVLGAATLLRMTPLSDRQSDNVEIIETSGKGLLSLLNDLLDVTKIEAGKLELRPEPSDLGEILLRIERSTIAHAEAKGLSFSSLHAKGLPQRIIADGQRLCQILQNLLSNAVKFTDHGGVELWVAVERPDVSRAELIFEVTDTGPGMSTEDLGRLFQPFTQLDCSPTRRAGGTGLGLTIARQLARQMGGEIEVRSKPGQGSTFVLRVSVEVLDWSAPATLNVEPTAFAEARPQRVLVVEDHPANQKILQAWLETMGHQVDVANNGEEALGQAGHQAFDLILMDVNMPVMDGLTAIRTLRAAPGPNREAKIVVLSASARPEDFEVGLLAGGDRYLTKPIDFLALSVVMSELDGCTESEIGTESERSAA